MHQPSLLYGTAWKEDDTGRLVELALRSGFRAIDTANQRKHYHEAAVGEGIAASGVPRDELFLQTKFTFVGGQDHRLPYDPGSPVSMQVEQSFERSLVHLKTTRLDSYVLHGPSSRDGLNAADLEAWSAMEALASSGRVTSLGISNVSVAQLEALLARATVPPVYVQNRCYASRRWDHAVRAMCEQHSIRYQGFSLLTANGEVATGPVVGAIARRLSCTPQQVIFRFAQQLGMLPLTGTTNPKHMRDDLAVQEFELSPDDLSAIETAGTRSS